MAPAHHIRIEAFFDYHAGTGFDHLLARQNGGTVRLLIEIRFDPFGLFRREQVRVSMGVRNMQTHTTGEHILARHAPFGCKSFYPLSRHLFYFSSAWHSYPATSGSIPLS
jgi:hypothetical protein